MEKQMIFHVLGMEETKEGNARFQRLTGNV